MLNSCVFDNIKEENSYFFASYYRQLSADIKMKIIRIICAFFSHEGQKDRANKTTNLVLILWF